MFNCQKLSIGGLLWLYNCRRWHCRLSVGRHLVTVLSSSCAWTRWRSLWQPQFDDPRKILGHTHWGWYIWLPCPSQRWGPQRQRTHSWWQQFHKCRLLQRSRPAILSEIGWDLRVVNEPYEWVEKAVVFRPEVQELAIHWLEPMFLSLAVELLRILLSWASHL